MGNAPKISETEWEIMRVIWKKHPISGAEIIATLKADDPSWHPKTARTLLGRLVKKGVLRAEDAGRGFIYEPRLNEKESIAAESESFLQRVFGGSLEPMLAHFVNERKLTKADLKHLHELLEGKRRENDDR
jgi:BlaI family penicillinase repressor